MAISSGEEAERIRVWSAGEEAVAHGHRLAGIWDVRGPAASVRRDAIFRRTLVAADLIAFLIAYLATIAVPGGAKAPTWGVLICAPVIIVVAKLIGLYDRDESLLRKTTLDEAPKLLELSALIALFVWVTGSLSASSSFDRRDAAVLLGLFLLFLLVMRAVARAAALAVSPSERCLVIGDELAAESIRSKLVGLSGVKAEVVARVDLDNIAPWTSDSFSEPRMDEVRKLAQALDIHRAVIAPRRLQSSGVPSRHAVSEPSSSVV